jgi:hypothetical protein
MIGTKPYAKLKYREVKDSMLSIRNILSTTGAELREGGSDNTRYRRFNP